MAGLLFRYVLEIVLVEMVLTSREQWYLAIRSSQLRCRWLQL